jgi:hypothetical protein
VKEMALHVAAMMAVFVDQVAQAPVAVNCPASAPELPWKWIIQSVAPVAGGTLIAVWSFVVNRRSEQRQWVRDQKKAEWRELLETLNSNLLPFAKKEAINSGMIESIVSLQRCLDSRIFIASEILKPHQVSVEHFWNEWKQSGFDDNRKLELIPKLLVLGDKLREDAKKDLLNDKAKI